MRIVTSKIYRIVLTGAACGGKSSALQHIKKTLTTKGFRVFTIPEAATAMQSNGVTQPSKEYTVSFELHLMNLQMHVEDSYLEIAQDLIMNEDNKSTVIIYDRGLMDCRAFISAKDWNHILDYNKWTNVGLRDGRYDGICHLTTTADGAIQHYTTENNKIRTETPEEAIELDRKIKEAWIGHPHLRIIDNSTDFNGKLDRLMQAIYRIIGYPNPIEKERKFLVRPIHNIPVYSEEIHIEQHYLAGPNASRIRKRGKGGSYIYSHTIKGPNNLEVENRIDRSSYTEWQKYAIGNQITKIRTCFLWKNQYFELDTFISPKSVQDIQILEIELDSDNQNVELPPFIKVEKEITGDVTYSNWQIARDL